MEAATTTNRELITAIVVVVAGMVMEQNVSSLILGGYQTSRAMTDGEPLRDLIRVRSEPAPAIVPPGFPARP